MAESTATAGSVVQDDVEEGAVDAQVAIVVDEAQLSELIQKEIHPRARRADHLGERLLTDLRHHLFGLPFFAKVGQQQEHSCTLKAIFLAPVMRKNLTVHGLVNAMEK